MKKKKISILSKAVFFVFSSLGKIAYRKTKIIGIENLPKTNTVIVANHAQLNGPIIAQLHLPDNFFIWANGQMFNFFDVPSYAMEDFFPFKKGLARPIFKAASYVLAPLMPCIMENARAIPVYHDARIASTFKTSVKMLMKGRNILIFPECHEKNNNIVNEFRESFVDLARLYFKRTGECLTFVPMYIAPNYNRCYFGKETAYDPMADAFEERHRIANHLSGEITRIGRMLPDHTVVPFDNIPKKKYISNKEIDKVPG